MNETTIWRINGEYVLAASVDQAIRAWQMNRWSECRDGELPSSWYASSTAKRDLEAGQDQSALQWYQPHTVERIGQPLTVDEASDRFQDVLESCRREYCDMQGICPECEGGYSMDSCPSCKGTGKPV